MRIGFLGAGKMATAMAKGLVDKGVCAATELRATDVLPAAREAFTAQTGVACAGDAAVLREVDVLVVAVKPQVAAAALSPLRDACEQLHGGVASGASGA